MALPQLAPDPYERIQELEEQVRQLEALLHEDDVLPFEPMAPQQRRMLNCLMRRDIATREQLYHAIHGFDPECPDSNTVNVIMSRVRQTLQKYRVKIHSQSHGRWYIATRDKEKLRGL